MKYIDKKIPLDIHYIDAQASEALYYIFCLLESFYLNVDLSEYKNEKEIRTFYASQKHKLIDKGAVIAYCGPDFSFFAKKELKYVFNLKKIDYKTEGPIKIIIDCFGGSGYHKHIATEHDINVEVVSKNGLKFCSLVYAGTIDDGKLKEDAIVWDIITNDMPKGFKVLGQLLNLFILKHFGITY